MLLFANFETSFAYFETHLHILKLKNIRILIIKNKCRDSLGNPGNVMILDIGVSPVHLLGQELVHALRID